MQWSERTDGANFHITRYTTSRLNAGHFARKAAAVRREINWLTHRMGNMAIDHINNNFKAEGFVDSTLTKWPKRKRGGKRPLLVKTGAMKRGIRATSRTRNSVSITTPVSYAGVHNRPVGEMKQYGPWNYPGRQFMGHSRVLADATKRMIVSRLNMAMATQ